eukprot:2551877-Pleurochrysis_carterae.AAC.2
MWRRCRSVRTAAATREGQKVRAQVARRKSSVGGRAGPCSESSQKREFVHRKKAELHHLLPSGS